MSRVFCPGIISTKFGYRVGPNQTRIDNSSPPTILPSLEGSLRRLNTDYIDYQSALAALDMPPLDAATHTRLREIAAEL